MKRNCDRIIELLITAILAFLLGVACMGGFVVDRVLERGGNVPPIRLRIQQ